MADIRRLLDDGKPTGWSAARHLRGELAIIGLDRIEKGRRKGGRNKGRTCPLIFEAVCSLLADRPDAAASDLWATFQPDGLSVFVGGDGLLHEDGGKSISRRTFDRYVTDAKRLLRTK